MQRWHLLALPLIEREYPLSALLVKRGWHLPALPPLTMKNDCSSEFFEVRAQGAFSNAKCWRGDIGSRFILKRRSYIKRRLYNKCRSEGGGVFGVSWNHLSWNCSDEVVCRVRWSGHVTTSLHLYSLLLRRGMNKWIMYHELKIVYTSPFWDGGWINELCIMNWKFTLPPSKVGDK